MGILLSWPGLFKNANAGKSQGKQSGTSRLKKTTEAWLTEVPEGNSEVHSSVGAVQPMTRGPWLWGSHRAPRAGESRLRLGRRLEKGRTGSNALPIFKKNSGYLIFL